ncbi:hypothetical protein [Tatumella punctata]|uniref:Uncharacterized protein n=1 Tax=Tatumella punctata TaxID=399969 RepID=A0ABW1VTV6_9GAMM
MPIWGPIVAAFIAALFGAIGLVINKENKISEFRQDWINEFRDEVSLLIEAYKQYLAAFQELEGKDDREAKKIKYDKSGELHRYRSKIKLRLNADESKRTMAEIKLDKLMLEMLTNPNNRRSVDIIGSIYKQTGIIFKREWEIVKRGEIAYTTTIKAFKCIAIVTGAILFLALAFHLQEILMWLMNIQISDYTAAKKIAS